MIGRYIFSLMSISNILSDMLKYLDCSKIQHQTLFKALEELVFEFHPNIKQVE